MIRIIRIFLLLAAACCTIPATAASLNMVCTIKPACLLLDAIVGETEKSTQLLPDNADLHHYSFRPSDLRKLSQANVVVRLSPTLEHFINRLLDPQKQTIITLENTVGLTRFPFPKQHQHHHGNEHDGHSKHAETEVTEEHQEHQEHDHASAQPTKEKLDPHFWLNPQNAIKMAHYLADELAKVNPTQAARYQQNSQLLIEKIRHSDQRIRKLLSTNQHKPYFAFHAGLQYFEKYYGLEAPEIVSLHEGLPVGIKTMRHLRAMLKTTNIPCLIAEPRANKALIRTLTENIAINIATLDAVGSTLPTTQHSYPSLFEHTANTLHKCLKNKHDNKLSLK